MVGEVSGRFVAADRPTASGIAASGRRKRDDQNTACDLRAHQPVRRRDRRVEERIAGPHIVDVVNTKVGMRKQMRGLSVDLKRILIAEEIRIKTLLRQLAIVLRPITSIAPGLPRGSAEPVFVRGLRGAALMLVDQSHSERKLRSRLWSSCVRVPGRSSRPLRSRRRSSEVRRFVITSTR
jgi:hypothetical protein